MAVRGRDEEKAGLHQGHREGHHPHGALPGHKEEEEEEEDSPKSSICCLQGCLAATAVGFSFFVALPTGILLVVYASNKGDIPLLSVGAVLISLPLIMLVVVVVLCFNQRRLARLGKNRVNSAAKKQRNLPAPTTTTTTTTMATITTTTPTPTSSTTTTTTTTTTTESVGDEKRTMVPLQETPSAAATTTVSERERY